MVFRIMFGLSLFFVSSSILTAKTRPVTLTELANRYGSDKGSSYACAHGYTRHYENLFFYRTSQITGVLEIGLNRDCRSDCASLRMWLDYFPNAHVFGYDIVKQVFTHPRVTLFWGDQADLGALEAAVNAIYKRCPLGLDLIVDDGSHASLDQQKSFLKFFPILKPGGYYCIESVHWQPYKEEFGMKTIDVVRNILQKNGILWPEQTAPEWYQPGIERYIKSINVCDSATQGCESLIIIQKTLDAPCRPYKIIKQQLSSKSHKKSS